MSFLEAVRTTPGDRNDAEKAAKGAETMLLKQLLKASGAFKGSDAAGASMHADLFVDVIAEAVVNAGGTGFAGMLQKNMEGPQPQAPHAAMPGDPSELLPLVAGDARISSPFGRRTDPLAGHQAQHRGVDVAAAEGTPILAAADGVVVRAGARGGYGNAVEVQHSDGVTTLYAHAANLLVREGDAVRRGQPIAEVGHTGRATGDHLHFEVRDQGRAISPAQALKAYRNRAEREGKPVL